MPVAMDIRKLKLKSNKVKFLQKPENKIVLAWKTE